MINQIPASATAQGDVRLSAADGAQRLQQALSDMVAKPLVADTVTTVAIEQGRPPFIATDAGYASRSGTAIVLEAFGLAIQMFQNPAPSSKGAPECAYDSASATNLNPARELGKLTGNLNCLPMRCMDKFD